MGGLDGLSANGSIYALCSDSAGNIYDAGDFTNDSGNWYVAKWNGSDWSELGGMNGLAANGEIFSVCSDDFGNIYAAGWFTNSSGNGYVAKYDLFSGIDYTHSLTDRLGIFPNPVSNTSTISFSISQPGRVSFKIFDVTGKLVKTLFDGMVEERESKMECNAGELKQGLYFLKMENENDSELIKISLMT